MSTFAPGEGGSKQLFDTLVSGVKSGGTKPEARVWYENVLAFQLGILNRDATLRRGANCELRLRYRPLRRVGVCIPGGAASNRFLVVPANARPTGQRE